MPSDLLREVMEQSASAEFQTKSFEKMLLAARRRKQVRQLSWSGIAVAVGVIALIGVLHRPTKDLYPSKFSVAIVHSQKLSPEMVLSTQQTVEQVKSSQFTIATIHTQEDGYRLVDDNELLRILAGHPAALVRQGDGHAELVFVNPADMEGFPVGHSQN